MKKLILLLTAILLLFSGCPKHCLVDSPKDIKPIDWENYNDVATLFWNYYALSSETKWEDENKEIMVYGWILNQLGLGVKANNFSLLDDLDKIQDPHPTRPFITIRTYQAIELQSIFDTCDLTKKCFVKGKLNFGHINTSGVCNTTHPEILITDINDIYFK
jgi:hypothetical protein